MKAKAWSLDIAGHLVVWQFAWFTQSDSAKRQLSLEECQNELSDTHMIYLSYGATIALLRLLK